MTRTARGVVFLSALVLLSARTAWSVCGDGMVDGTEQCDLGAGNGTAGTCCTNLCEFRAAGLTCRPIAGPCDIAETCTGTSATCPGDVFRPSNFICRPSAGICDVQETCTGTSAPCPADAVQPTTTFCRPSAGPCDVTDFCDGVGTACPADAKSTAECRGVAGPCDVAESCDGVNDTCPPDGFEPSTVVCRPSAGVCDVAESCTGGAAACPADAFEPSSTVCRPSSGVCDPAESCTGFTAACPGDAKSTAVCRPSAGVCDLAESCDGVNDACPPDAKSTAPCRSSAGVCDVAESCDGVNDGCPADGFQPSSTVCRPAAGPCDAAEQCTGTGAACPADGKSTGVCRPAAGDCDVAESCDGVSNTCPPDGFVTVGTVCRPAAPFCDVAESCTGLGPACPPNQFLPDGTACDDGIACTADACSGGACVGTPDLDVCLDEYLCYKTKISQATTMPVVTLEDQFDTAPVSYQVVKGRHVCTPANRNGTGVNDPVTHLRSYTIKAVPGSPKFQRRTLLRVTNDLGEIRLDATKPDLLLVPVDKDLTTDPPPPMTSALDHFKCYKVKVSIGTPRFVSTAVSMTDQFTSPAKSFLLKKPRHLCNPVDKNGEGINNPTAHLLCYKAKGGIPKHVRRIGVHVNGQFGPEIVDTVKEDEICIPSAKALSPSGAFVDGMEGSLL
jgi:disintegrin